MDYLNGKIYKIITPQCEKYYIGSTADSLNGRFSNHIQDYKKWKKNGKCYVSSYDLFDLGIDDARIELIEKFPCNSKKELERREGELHKLFSEQIVNWNIAGRTMKEWIVDNPNYYPDRFQRLYSNPQIKKNLLEKNKEWRENNKERRAEYQKQYAQKNAELLKEKRRIREAKKKIN